MKHIILLLASVSLLFASCRKAPFDTIADEGQITFELRPKGLVEVKTRSNAYENDLNGIYLLVFDQASDLFVECKAATNISNNNYTAKLTPTNSKVKILAVANVASIVEAKKGGWIKGTTTYLEIFDQLITNDLSLNNGAIIAMPERPPMSGEQIVAKIEPTTVIATPFEMERATAKITISSTAENFTLLGANLYNAPTKGYVMPNQSVTNLLAISRANYVGADGVGGYGADYMISQATLSDPLYCYQTPLDADPARHPFVIIKSNRGYYRINLVDKDNNPLNIQRNYYYKIVVTNVITDGATTADDAKDDPPLGADVVVTDPDSNEVISDGVDYLGLTNSELIIYDSYAIHEFNSDAFENANGSDYEAINGYSVAIVTYKGKTAGSVKVKECKTKSGVGKIRFQNALKGVWETSVSIEETYSWGVLTDELTLPKGDGVANKRIIINIPHDFVSGILTVKVGNLEREIKITRNSCIAFTGDVLDFGTGFSTAYIDFEFPFIAARYIGYEPPGYNAPIPAINKKLPANAINFSASQTGNWSKSLELSPSNNLYVKINPLFTDFLYRAYPDYTSVASEFYLTRDANQARVKVHLIQESYRSATTDAFGTGSPYYKYCSAFWKNDESGERIIRVPSINQDYFWTARVIYGEDFIRLSNVDSRTVGVGDRAVTSGDPEDHRPDGTWTTFLEPTYTNGRWPFPQFRVGLTGSNPNPSKPRYGLIALSIPYTSRGGESSFIFVRQGETTDYVFSPTDTYNGAPRTYAQQFSTYNLTVADTLNHLGGPNYSDHKSMGGPGVFAEYPTQQGYLYQWGNDRAIHPENPATAVAIIGYTYHYDAPKMEVCPAGYTMPTTDNANIATLHSFEDPNIKREGYGLCADGFFDRQAYSTRDLYVGEGAERGHGGRVYYNAQTLASIFIPQSAQRPDGVQSYDRNDFIMWGNIPTETGNQQGVLGALVMYDRKSAFPIRCVKKP